MLGSRSFTFLRASAALPLSAFGNAAAISVWARVQPASLRTAKIASDAAAIEFLSSARRRL